MAIQFQVVVELILEALVLSLQLFGEMTLNFTFLPPQAILLLNFI